MQRILNHQGTSPSDRAQLHFGLFNAFDQFGETDTAFAHLSRGNALRKAELNYDIARDAALFAWLKTLRLPGASAKGAGVTPIFVTGLPRSGTTLTEHLLSHGADVRPAGELALVKSAIAPILRTLQGEKRNGMSPDEVLDLQRILRNRLSEYAGGHSFVIDKMPLNFRWIGFLRAALPEARIIVMRRDPMALSWSLYRQCFGEAGNGFAYDLGDIACYQAIARDLITHFEDDAPDRIIAADLSRITADPFVEAQKLRRACGIPDPDGAFSKTGLARPILTASSDQVRQAVDPGRDSAWRRYAKHLEPLQNALDTLGNNGL